MLPLEMNSLRELHETSVRLSGTSPRGCTRRSHFVCKNARMNKLSSQDEAAKRPRFLTVEQVAEELNVGQPTVRMLLRSGELRGIQIGGRGLWRVASADLENYIADAYQATAEKIAAGELTDEKDSGSV